MVLVSGNGVGIAVALSATVVTPAAVVTSLLVTLEGVTVVAGGGTVVFEFSIKKRLLK